MRRPVNSDVGHLYLAMLRTALTLAITFGLAAFSLPGHSARPQKSSSVDTFPDTVMKAELHPFQGRLIHLDDYKGNVVVLAMWASWCGPCVTMLPDLTKLNNEYSSRGLVVIGITKDEQDDAAKFCEISRAYDVNFNLAWADKNVVSEILGKKDFVPQVFVIGKEGSLRKRFTPFVPIAKYQAQLRDEVNGALDVDAQKP